ncbi:dienelactone hydrolase [Croceibacterium mercuriale]|uniref:Dienelactone hydrolase n=1 Tax=Croceibacterium mercuriale TaxID=1572751 RepID=A0A0B2BTB6_9SPHN|nr:alpha/beta hydrolase [Croceibacterium mercuriale]KHL24669.1 dienelactone hydrolase [Croceibacterium mercuriale]
MTGLDRRSLLAAGVALSAGLATGAARGQTAPPSGTGAPAGLPDPAEVIDLWPAGAPGAPAQLPVEAVTQRSTDPAIGDRSVQGIAVPRMVVFRPAQPNGAAMLVTPGGGYRLVVVDKEGYELARWMTERGFTVFVLFYRLPGEGWANRADVPLADAQRAMRLIRHRAAEYGIDPERVGAMGFSAGGHVCADLSTRFAHQAYTPVDAADQLSARPCASAPIYPVISMDADIAHAGSRDLLLGPAPSPELEAAHSPDRNVPADAPPFFLLHAEDDGAVPVANTLRLREALKAQGLRVETHLFEVGGHGFGLRNTIGKPVEIWPELWRAWARTTPLG